jgi:uroporphyrinogen decarboxylase
MSTSQALIQNLLTGQNFTRVGLREVNIWPDTVQAWLEQGYPTQETTSRNSHNQNQPANWVDHFGYDMVKVGGEFDYLPKRGFREVLEETETWVVARDGAGAVFKTWKHKSGMPEHIDFTLTSRAVWEREYRPHLLEVDRARVDIDGARQALALRRAQGRWTFYQHMFVWETMRQTMGDVCMYTSLALDPDWIHDFNRVYTDFYKAHFQLLFKEAGLPDGIRLCEDLGYNKGLFCSPNMLEELIFPYFSEIVDFFHGYGLLVELHSCGNITQAMPLIADLGFDALNPMEVKAGCDPFGFAEEYSDRLAFIGGLDVRVLESGDRDLIRREVASLIDGMKARRARYVFGSDHSITPLVRYQDYCYALEVYREHMSY